MQRESCTEEGKIFLILLKITYIIVVAPFGGGRGGALCTTTKTDRVIDLISSARDICLKKKGSSNLKKMRQVSRVSKLMLVMLVLSVV